MAEFTYNYFYYLISDGGGDYTKPAGFVPDSVLTDGMADMRFERGDQITDRGLTGVVGAYVGTVRLNGQTFILVEQPGYLVAHGWVPDDYEPVAEWDPREIDPDPIVVCFLAGTRVLTDRGEVAVEALRAGDLVATLGRGGGLLAPVLFVGRRRIRLAGHPRAAELAPVRIRAGALAEGTPHRDLLVSPDHCLFLDGALVPARLLVNGRTIARERSLAEVTYLHIELPRHDVVLAEGAAAESWLDCGNRAWFANAPGALLRVEGTLAAHAREAREPCAPVLQAGPALAALRDPIALRAGAAGRRLAA